VDPTPKRTSVQRQSYGHGLAHCQKGALLRGSIFEGHSSLTILHGPLCFARLRIGCGPSRARLLGVTDATEPDAERNLPPTFDTGMTEAELDGGDPRPFDTPWGSFTVWRLRNGGMLARESFCPHLLGPLFQGSRHDDVLVCPWHDWRYSLESGECQHSPRDEGQGSRIRALFVEVGPQGTLVLSPAPETP
jgi:nitrite reductase/ring-hydroxylating ferredoxin subunit